MLIKDSYLFNLHLKWAQEQLGSLQGSLSGGCELPPPPPPYMSIYM